MLVVCICLGFLSLQAQTTIPYVQQVANYDATFNDAGGNFDNGADQIGLWANGNGLKESVVWKNFTEDGTPTGTPSIMALGDIFKITLNATRAWGEIGVALLASPSSTASYADRINNYGIIVKLTGNGDGSFNPWTIVSQGGTETATAIDGAADNTHVDVVITFQRTDTNDISVDINGSYFFVFTMNNINLTGYSVFIKDDWNGTANSNMYVKPTTEYTYLATLSDDVFDKSKIKVFTNSQKYLHVQGLPSEQKANVQVFNVLGKQLIETQLTGRSNQEISLASLNGGLYIVRIATEQGIVSKKIVLN